MKISKSKKFISVGLAGLVAAQSSAYADWATDFVDSSMVNITPSGSYSGPGGKKMWSSGSVYFRFGPASQNYEPIYHISPPDISVSCSGFNLKGLFVSFIGFERIAKMLKSAGASFAWGIVVGLIYSLPGIFSAFKMLNAWAKKIMQLLQNACKGGMEMGKNISKATGLDEGIKKAGNFFDKYIGDLGAESATGAVENSGRWLASAMGMKEEWFFGPAKEDMSYNEDEDLASPETVKGVYGDLVAQVVTLKSRQNNFINSLFMQALSAGNESEILDLTNRVLDNNLLNVVTDTNIVGLTGKFNISWNITERETDSTKTHFETYTADDLVKMAGSTEFINKYRAILIKEFMYSNTMEQTVASGEEIENIIFNGNISLEATNTGSTPSNEELSSIQNVYDKGSAGSAKEGTLMESAAYRYGKFIGYLFAGKEGGVSDSELSPDAFDSWKTISYQVVGIQEGRADSTNSAFAFVGIPNDKPLFDKGTMKNSIPTVPVSEKIDSFIEDILNGQTIDAAAANNSIPPLIGFPESGINIYRMTGDIEARKALKLKIIEAGQCSFASAVISLFKDAEVPVGGSGFFSSNGLSVVKSKNYFVESSNDTEEDVEAIKLINEQFFQGMKEAIYGQMLDKPKTSMSLVTLEERKAQRELFVSSVNNMERECSLKIEELRAAFLLQDKANKIIAEKRKRKINGGRGLGY